MFLIEQLIREIEDFKNRLQRFEADNGSLQQEVIQYFLHIENKSIFRIYKTRIFLIRINVMKLNLHDINNN